MLSETPHLGDGRLGADELLRCSQLRSGETSLVTVRTATGLCLADGLHLDGGTLLHERREARSVGSGRELHLERRAGVEDVQLW